jgi:hypothetical protein
MDGQQKVDASSVLWQDVVGLCPLVCEIANPGPNDYVDAVGIGGLHCKRAVRNYVPGTLTVEVQRWGWLFSHPGLSGGQVFVHVMNGDTTPRYKGVTILVENK